MYVCMYVCMYFALNIQSTVKDLLTLFQARSGITLPGQTGQILPTYTFNHINQLSDFVVPKTYSLTNILTFRWP